MSMKKRPTVRLQPRHDARLRHGHPWAYSNEIMMDAEAKAIPAGTPVTLTTAGGERLGVGFFNPHTLIAARVLTTNADTVIDRAFFTAKLQAALRLRERLYAEPYYRLVHAEADGLPAIVIDRMGDVLVVQLNAAGPDLARDEIVAALVETLNPKAIVLKNESPARALEGLPVATSLAFGELSGPVELIENGARFGIDPLGGRLQRPGAGRLLLWRRIRHRHCHSGGGVRDFTRSFGVGARSCGPLGRAQWRRRTLHRAPAGSVRGARRDGRRERTL
jgi:23S rRNA (cytosine1962-C5)-methyltransferase